MFNPFDKELDSISFDDIKSLKDRGISEGLYVEYKSEFPSNSKISHSIASFANSYGGWYIVGVETDSENIPTAFSGISNSRNPNIKEKVRDISRDHVNPIPIVRSKIVPVDENNSIIVISIDESNEPPHICKDGKIYRRNGEGSDPVAETDRYAIDRLYDKAGNFETTVNEFCNNDLVVSKAQETQGWLEMYVMTYPFRKLSIKNFFSKENRDELKNIMKENTNFNDAFSAGMEFNTNHSSTNSLIFKNVEPTNMAYVGTSYIPYFNGNCKIIIPLPYVPQKTSEEQSITEKQIYAKIQGKDHHLFKIIDGFHLIDTFLVMLAKHLEYLRRKEWKDNVLLAYRFENTWRNILMLESESFRNQIEEDGLPVCQQNNGFFPTFRKQSLIYKIPGKNIQLLAEFNNIAEYFGIFHETFQNSTKEWMSHLMKKAQQ